MGKIVKYCAVCEEGFAEKFAFCPNCGGALTAYEMNPVAAAAAAIPIAADTPKADIVQPEPEPQTQAAFVPTPTPTSTPVIEQETEEKVFDDEYLPEETAAYTIASAAAAADDSNGNGNGFHNYQSNFQSNDLKMTKSEDDGGFHVTVIEDKNTGSRNALLLGSWLLVMTLTLGGVVWSLFNKEFNIDGIGSSDLLSAVIVNEDPTTIEEEKPEEQKKDDAGGGGGGGRNKPDPVSNGRLAMQSPEKPLFTPSVEIPQMKTDMPMRVTTQGPPRPADVKEGPYGDPNSQSYKLSDGTGSGGGQGSGKGTGQGSGEGTGAGSGRGSGMGGGIGDGIGNGKGGGKNSSGVDDEPPPSKPVGPTEGVKILSKPRANYTDAARQANITGVVRLKVTFLANGSIGSITPVSGLGYGLTEQAIAAARSIRFEPAKKGGTPTTSTRTIEYSFTLY